MSTTPLRVEIDGAIASVIFDEPTTRNAISQRMVDALHAALATLGARDDLAAVILRSADPRTFVSGADIAELKERGAAEAMRMINTGVFRAVERCPVPTIACITGYALGGGCELALACDVRVGGQSAKLGQPEVSLGIVPGAGATYRLPRLVGPGIARELIFTGRIIEADEALRIGLVNCVVPDAQVLTRALSIAQEIAANSRGAVRHAKALMNQTAEMSTDAAMLLEATTQAVLFESEDKHARMAAFLEKRQTARAARDRDGGTP